MLAKTKGRLCLADGALPIVFGRARVPVLPRAGHAKRPGNFHEASHNGLAFGRYLIFKVSWVAGAGITRVSCFPDFGR